MPISIEIQLENVAQVAATFERKGSFSGKLMAAVGREAIREVKGDIKGEIDGQYYLAGGRQAWDRTSEFGRLRAGRPALRSFARKWASAAPRITPRSAEIQISVPGGPVHVGGTGTQRQKRVTPIRARGNPRAMQGAIARKTGAFVSRRTLAGPGLQLPSRPHANPDNPETARKVELVMARRFEGA